MAAAKTAPSDLNETQPAIPYAVNAVARGGRGGRGRGNRGGRGSNSGRGNRGNKNQNLTRKVAICNCQTLYILSQKLIH